MRARQVQAIHMENHSIRVHRGAVFKPQLACFWGWLVCYFQFWVPIEICWIALFQDVTATGQSVWGSESFSFQDWLELTSLGHVQQGVDFCPTKLPSARVKQHWLCDSVNCVRVVTFVFGQLWDRSTVIEVRVFLKLRCISIVFLHSHGLASKKSILLL